MKFVRKNHKNLEALPETVRYEIKLRKHIRLGMYLIPLPFYLLILPVAPLLLIEATATGMVYCFIILPLLIELIARISARIVSTRTNKRRYRGDAIGAAIASFVVFCFISNLIWMFIR